MRKAVVPVDEKRRISSGITTNAKVRKPVYGFFSEEGDATAWVDDGAGKLTKEDIETLVRVYEEFRPDTWKDKSECMVLAVTSIGIEVED